MMVVNRHWSKSLEERVCRSMHFDEVMSQILNIHSQETLFFCMLKGKGLLHSEAIIRP